MDKLKALFPVSFAAKDTRSLLISILLYLGFGIVAGIACKLLAILPLIGGFLSWIVGLVSGLYVLVGLVLTVLYFFKVIR